MKHGIIKYIKKGIAVITVLSVFSGGMGVSASAALSAKVKDIKIVKPGTKDIVLNQGSTYQLKVKVTVKGNISKKVTYKSSKPGIVKVSKNGKLAAIKKGKARITVKSVADHSKKAVCNVVVKEKSTPVTKTEPKYGNLQICNTDHDKDASSPDRMMLCDSKGNPVQLKGMSTFGLQWEEGNWVLNEKAFDALAYDWKCDIIRLAMYVQEDGYASHPQELLDRMEKGIKLATERGMYVIADWHILSPGDPCSEAYLDAGLELAKKGGPFYEIAKKHPEYNGPQLFFAYLSQKYGAQSNILFEVANEPNGLGNEDNAAGTWSSKLKPYFENVISAIREYDADSKDNIVICGTDSWSQFVNAPVSDPVKDKSVMYTVHFYAGTHDAGYDDEEDYWLRAKIDEALNNGLAVFCTEWGTSEATGDGGPYIDFAERWLNYFEKNKISWCSWSMAKKDEISAACTKDTLSVPEDINGDGIPEWDSKTLSISGNYVRARIRGEEAPVYTESEIAVDFENGIDNCIVDAESPNQDIVLGQEIISGNALKISNIQGDNIWDNRIRLSDLGTTYGIYQNLAFDLVIKNEDVANANICIKPVIQSEATGWWGDAIVEQVFNKENFVPLKDGYSICHAVFPLKPLKPSPADSLGHIMLLLASGGCNSIYIDNVEFFSSSNGDIKYKAKLPDNPGEYVSMPFTFESGTREGWVTDGTSKLDYEDFTTGIAETTALKFPVAFDGTNNEWEDGARISSPFFPEEDMTLEKSKKVQLVGLDVYLEPGHATEGSLDIIACPIPNGAGYWYQAGEQAIDPVDEGEIIINSEGTKLMKYHISIPFSEDGNYPYSDEVPIRNLVLVFKSDNANYNGYIYCDNITLSE